MTNTMKTNLDRYVNIAQLVVLIAGIFVVAMKVGARDQILTDLAQDNNAVNLEQKELRKLVTELVKSQTASNEQITALRRDIDRLIAKMERR